MIFFPFLLLQSHTKHGQDKDKAYSRDECTEAEEAEDEAEDEASNEDRSEEEGSTSHPIQQAHRALAKFRSPRYIPLWTAADLRWLRGCS